MKTIWHTFSTARVFEALRSGEQGLSPAEVARRRSEYGANVLPEPRSESLFITFLYQFQSPLIYLLLAAALAVLLTGETADGFIILAVLIFNAIVGTIQEGRAQNTLRALRHLVETTATVVRDGVELIIPDTELVPGDMLILTEGGRVPADARVVTSYTLKADESSLTGESVPVHKTTDVLRSENASPAEQHNMVFKGTTIVTGTGRAVVIATGSQTEIGGIAKEIAAIDSEVPLKADIRFLSRIILGVVALIGALIFILGIYAGNPLSVVFATVVSLSVSIIPEGLPVVITLVLASGVWRMSRRNVLVKKLHAVEALGQSSIIAVDKTGTITRNELTVVSVWAGDSAFDVQGSGYEPSGLIALHGAAIDAADHPELLLCGKIAALCANARPLRIENPHVWRVAGDPTEAAMFVFAQKVGFHRDTLEGTMPLIAELPFDYKLKYHAALHGDGGGRQLSVTGAPEEILALSSGMWRAGKRHALNEHERKELETVFLRMSEKGLRVVACASRNDASPTLEPSAVHSLTFAGFLGMKDALRTEVREAARRAEEAGIRVVMITGDHMVTARSIARDAGIFRAGDRVLSGREIDALSDDELPGRLAETSIFARVTPEHKLRIITAYKKKGLIVAMTGDGVNDAPSLVAADLGVAMGVTGTEVAKEAADLVLLDDNFGSIVSAVEEGRSIYKTIQKVILYLFSTSVGEVLTISGALILGLPLPLLPVQIIWLNFVTDGFLDVALAMEPREKGLLAGFFERPKRFLVNGLMAERIAVMATPMALASIAIFVAYQGESPEKAWTMTLTMLAVFQWFNAWNCRSESESLFRMNPFSNPYLVGATAIVFGLQLCALYLPPLQQLLHTSPLTLSEWGIIVAAALSIVAAEEGRKALYRFRVSA
ncbi:HAD-IC family P-type ATPase [Candidatus Kaiserbacteria bacterium]|nr:HAD-IC family P-type ATPase [Candidatus Kaiserbacteria bacterium]